MKLTDIAVRRPVGVVMLVIAVLLLGMVSFSRLALDLIPDIDVPVVVVVTTYPGAGPQEVEQLVTQPVEESVATVEGLKKVSSSSQSDYSTVIAEFDWGVDMNVAAQDVREQVDLSQGGLPSDADRSMVLKFDPGMLPVLVAGFSGDQNLADLHRIGEDIVKPRLERLEGVASVTVQGGLEREIQVQLDPTAMQGYGISPSQVTQAIQGGSLNLPGGSVTEGTREYTVRVPGEFVTIKDIEGVVVSGPEGAPVRLVDIAAIEDGYKEMNVVSRLDGQACLSISVQKQPQANTVHVADQVKETMAAIEAELPGNLKFESAFDQAEFIELSIGSLRSDLLMGGLMAGLVIFIFLRNLRTTLIICSAIPLAIIGASNMIYFSGETLNLLTLGGLALGVGIIVDDSIVILENIYRHRQGGVPALDAARVGASEVAAPVIGSSLSTMAVFLPIVFVGGMASELFAPLSLTVVFSLVASLITALTLVPMLGSRLLARVTGEPGPDEGRFKRLLYLSGAWLEKLKAAYRRVLNFSLRRRAVIILGTVGIFVGSILLVPLVGSEFMPDMDQGSISIRVEMPRGTNVEETDRVAAMVEEVVTDIPEVETVFVRSGVGSQMETTAAADEAMVDLMLVPLRERNMSAPELAEDLRLKIAEIPGASFHIDTSGGMGEMMGGDPIHVRLTGEDLDILDHLGQQIVALVEGVEGTREVRSSLEEGRPEVQVLVDRDRATAYGLGMYQLASTVRSALHGDVAAQYRVGGDEIDIRVRLAADSRKNIADLESLMITTPTGAQVLLSDVASLSMGESPVAIAREDQVRTVAVTGKIAGDRDLGGVTADIQAGLDGLALPGGYYADIGGEAEEMAEAFGELGFALLMAVALMYIILAVLFESALFPLVIMFTVPVSLVGMVLGLLVTGRAFSITAFIGAIVTVGVVAKNGIVLVDYINQLRERGMERNEAIKEAGPIRLRPILMTALTTVFAMFPIALGLGEGAEFQAPLATVIIGGLVASTLISLLLVPVVYTIFDDWGKALKGRFGRRGQSSRYSVDSSQ